MFEGDRGSEELKDKFTLTCKWCSSENTEVTPLMDGRVIISCNDCKNDVWMF